VSAARAVTAARTTANAVSAMRLMLEFLLVSEVLYSDVVAQVEAPVAMASLDVELLVT